MKKTILAIFIISLFVIATKVQAQGIPLQVAPARQQITIDPGGEATVNVKFFNLGETPIIGFIKAADFIVDNKEGTPKIIDDPSQTSPRFSASTWLTLPYDQVTIAPNDRISFQVKIKVPANAKPGGRYAAVYFETAGAVPQPVTITNEAGASVTHRLASLIYIRVNGPISENAIITRLFSTSFHEYGPIDVETEILNRGDYHIRPKGVLTLTNMFGGMIDQAPLKEQNIFPDTARVFTNSLGKKWLIGRYKIDLKAAYGEHGGALSQYIYVWVFPWKVALIIVLSIIIVVLVGNNIYKKLLVKESQLEEEIIRERQEIEKLRDELRQRNG